MHTGEVESDPHLELLLDTLAQIRDVIEQEKDTFPLFLSRTEPGEENEDVGKNGGDITSAIDLLKINGCSYEILGTANLSQLKGILREVIKEMGEEIRFAELLAREEKETGINKMKKMKTNLERATRSLFK